MRCSSNVKCKAQINPIVRENCDFCNSAKAIPSQCNILYFLPLSEKFLNTTDFINDRVSRVELSCQSVSFTCYFHLFAPSFSLFWCSSAFSKFIEQVIAKKDEKIVLACLFVVVTLMS